MPRKASRPWLAVGLCFGLSTTTGCRPEAIFADVQNSHIQGNVPAPSKFDRLLKRDLTAHFHKAGKKVEVVYESLREGPTQSGTSYPKYYLWVELRKGGTKTEEGAVRVAAMDKSSFAVTDYLSTTAMLRNPTQIDSVFPAQVCDKIRARLQRR